MHQETGRQKAKVKSELTQCKQKTHKIDLNVVNGSLQLNINDIYAKSCFHILLEVCCSPQLSNIHGDSRRHWYCGDWDSDKLPPGWPNSPLSMKIYRSHLCWSADLRSAWSCMTEGTHALFISCHHVAHQSPVTFELTLSKTFRTWAQGWHHKTFFPQILKLTCNLNSNAALLHSVRINCTISFFFYVCANFYS